MKRRKRRIRKRKVVFLAIILCMVFIVGKSLLGNLFTNQKIKELENTPVPEWIDVQLINSGSVARNGQKLDDVKDIVIHYIGNPGTTAQQNRDFYNSPESEVSSHFVIGLEGEIIQAIPLNEKSSATNWRNNDTISIEVCHPDQTGKFTKASRDSLIRLTAWLKEKTDLDNDHIIRHYDVTGKLCPLYFVEHEDQWVQFKSDVQNYSQY